VNDSEQEYARMAGEARRTAHEAEVRKRAQAQRAKAGALIGGVRDQVLRQAGLIYGGLIGVTRST
jgi:hypothetical protein